MFQERESGLRKAVQMDILSPVPSIVELVRAVVTALVAWDVPTLEELAPGWQASQEGFLRAIQRYPYKLCLPPADAYAAFEYSYDDEQEYLSLPPEWDLPMIYIVKTILGDWAVACCLWTQEEGVSDLAIVLSLGIRKGEMRILELRDILVR